MTELPKTLNDRLLTKIAGWCAGFCRKTENKACITHFVSAVLRKRFCCFNFHNFRYFVCRMENSKQTLTVGICKKI